MKRINKTGLGKIAGLAVLAAAMFLLNMGPAAAQARRLAQRQASKVEKQVVAPTEPKQENAALVTNDQPSTLPTRPLQQVLPGVKNPRLHAIVLDRFLPRLDLSQAQRTQIQAIRFQHVRRLRTLLDLERAQTRAYDEALFDLSLDQKEIEKRMMQLAETRTDMLQAQARFFLDLRQILTPEQFTRLRELMEEERALRRNAP